MAEGNDQEFKGQGTSNANAKEFYTEAGKAFEQNEFEKSIEMYSKAIDADPSYASAYFNRALSYAIINKYDEATKDAKKVLAMEPDSYDAPYVMGIIAEYQHDYDGAKNWYERALKKNPKYEQAKVRLDQLKTKFTTEGSGGTLNTPSPAIQKEGTDISEGQIKKVKWFTSSLTFKDVVGMTKQKKLIHENIILAIKKPELLRAYGKKLGLGVIFFGPPGCGKTYFVNAIGGETGSKVIIAAINEIVDMYAGNTEKNMHAIFEQARKNTPCIVFFDEIDALGGKREGGGGGEQQSFMRMAVNQFLTEMDGVEKNPEGIFVLAATNQPWDIDPALKRSKRFGESIYLPPPDYKTRRSAFIYDTRKMPLAHMDFGRLARATMGFSQADIDDICDKSALIPAAEEDRTGRRRKIKMSDFLRMIKSHGNTLDEWYAMVKKSIISKTETNIVDGKKQTVVKEGKLSPEEKQRYKALIKDVKRNSSPFYVSIKKAMRWIALNII